MATVREEDYLQHYGIARRSGRYPWGSGGNDEQHARSFLGMVKDLRKQGLSDTDISTSMGMSVAELRAESSIARAAKKQADINMAQRLKDAGNSNVAIGKRMGIPESTVRTLLAPGEKDKVDVIQSTAGKLKDAVDRDKYIDIGVGVERHLGISKERLAAAASVLTSQGYAIHNVQVDQLGTNTKTIVKVLAPPGTTYLDAKLNRDNIRSVMAYSGDGGRTYTDIKTPLSIDSRRVSVRYAKDGGAEADGVIYVRPGVEDVSLGGSRYAQVRIAVDGTHYLKGMAMYHDKLPPGVDLQFNTNKDDTGNKLDAMKPLKSDADLPFGAMISRQITKKNAKGEDELSSVMNIVNDESDWEKWSRTLSSQMLSKQSTSLAKTQLDLTYENKRNELDNILALTNPSVKQKLLQGFSEGVDASAVHLKAAALPRQKTHVILPINSLKETEVYAPNFQNGEKVVLIRFPHGGKFEIPELVVNNKNPEGRRLLGGSAKNAIGINHKVAQRLSGADFDGDTVLVIPNNHGKVKTEPPLEGLKNFDPIHSYPKYPGMKVMTAQQKATQMGLVSNLITDMTIQNAPHSELARAVRHSMVVIDAEKHELDWKLSATKNGISQLMEKYQGRKTGGASTIISRKKGEVDVPERKISYKIDPATGKKIYNTTNATYVNKRGETVLRTSKAPKLLEIGDANQLSSGTPIEKVYADHSNRLKALANEARLAMIHTKPTPLNDSASRVYKEQVNTLTAKLNVALMNAPRERAAQVLANAKVKQKVQANPGMEKSELKKVRSQALTDARIATGAGKTRVDITPKEWEAIQAGAISPSKLKDILENADLDKLKELAMPPTAKDMTSTKKQRATAMLASGYTLAEVAAHLGVSVSTLSHNLPK